DSARLPLGAVLRLPLTPVEAAVDGDRAALREVLCAALALVAPDGDVEVVGLVAPLARGRVLLAGVDRDAELADGGAARRVPELRVLGQVPNENAAVDVGHYSSSSAAPGSGSGASCRSSRGDATVPAGRCSLRRTAMWRMTPSVILRTRETSSRGSGWAEKVSRWYTPSVLWSLS